MSLQGISIFRRHAFSPLSEVITVTLRPLLRASFAVAAIMASIEAKLCTNACVITFFASATVVESNGSITTVKSFDFPSKISLMSWSHALTRFLFHFFRGAVYLLFWQICPSGEIWQLHLEMPPWDPLAYFPNTDMISTSVIEETTSFVCFRAAIEPTNALCSLVSGFITFSKL